MSRAYLAITACIKGSIAACFNRRLDAPRTHYVISTLLSTGVHPDLSHDGQNPLLAAVVLGDHNLVTTLLQYGAYHDYSVDSLDTMTPLHHAAANGHEQLVELFLRLGANVNARDIDSWTPLHWAASDNRPSIIRRLVAAGATLESTSISGRTPLHVAARCGHGASVAALLQLGASPAAKDEDGATPRDLAEENAPDQVVHIFDSWSARPAP